MAAKLPTSIIVENLGSAKLVIASFDGTVSSNDIDNADTWASGIKAPIGYWATATSGTTNAIAITGVSTGTFTFGSSGNITGTVFVLCKD
jgi:bacillopeptidase F (M6 metalloprotease family)